MYNKKLRIILVSTLALGWVAVFIYYYLHRQNKTQPPSPVPAAQLKNDTQTSQLHEALSLFKSRKNKEASQVFTMILLEEPNNLGALWGKAEILRRMHKEKEAEIILQEILKREPSLSPALTSLAYICYKNGQFKDALALLEKSLKNKASGNEELAITYVLIGAVNGKRAKKGGLMDKFIYGTQIKNYFLKAKELAPDLSEVHLGLGTFYLTAPPIAGGDLQKAIEELELTIKLAPDFSTPYARLAQAYKKEGNLEKYNFYLQRAKELDPEDEAITETY